MKKNAVFFSVICFLAGFLAALLFVRRMNVQDKPNGCSDVPPPTELMRSVQLVEGENDHLPQKGEATLRDLFGWRAALALHSALGGRYATTDRPCAYERNGGITRIWLPALTGSEDSSTRMADDSVPVWTLEIDNRTGYVLQTVGLPDLSGRELLYIANPAHQANPAVARLTENDSLSRSLLGEPKALQGTNCYDVHGQRVGDRMKYYWRGVFSKNPAPDELNLVRFVYWIDITSRSVVDSAVEVRGMTVAIP